MVKDLIKGILKKSDKPAEEVPDELPPIKDEHADSKEQAQPAEQKGTSPSQIPQPEAQNSEAPAELPDIQEADAPAPAPQMQEEHQVPEETHSQHEENAEMQQQKAAQIPQPPESHEGFFSRLSHLLKSGRNPDKVMSQNLLSTMKESYTIKKESAKTGLNQTDEKRVKQSVDEIMGMLKLLEGKWRAQKMVLDEDERTLKEYEQKIRDSEKQLKKMLRQYKIYQAPPQPLVMKNYLEVRNVSELYNALRTLDEKTYLAHAGKGRNDFAEFTKAIDKQLALKLSMAKSKTGMLKVLELFISKHKE